MIIGVENNILPTISQPDLNDRRENPVIDVMRRVLIENALNTGTIPDQDTPLLQSGIKPNNVYTSSPEFANQVISGKSFQTTQVETKKGIFGRTKTKTKTTTSHLDLEERTQRFIDALPEVGISNKAKNAFPGFVDRLLNTTSYGDIELFRSDGSITRDGSDLVFEALINYTGETADILGPNYTDALTLLSEAFETYSQEFLDGNSPNTPRELVELILEGKIALNLLLTNHLANPNASLDEVAQNALDIRDSVKDISAPDLALLEREAHKFASLQTSVLVPTKLATIKRVRLGDNLGEISVKDLHEIASGDISSADIRRRLSTLIKEYEKIEGKTMTPIELQRIARDTLNRVYKDEQLQEERGEDVEMSLSMISALPDSDEVTTQFLENIALKLDRLTPEQKKKLELGLNLTRFSVIALTSIVGIGVIDALNDTPDNFDGETYDGWSHYQDEISLHDSNSQPTHQDHEVENHLASVSIEDITKGGASDDLNVTVDIDNNDITTQEEIEPTVIHACFVAGTKVSTDEGEINIEQLAKGDEVISWDLEQERKLTTTIIKSFSRKVETYFKVIIDNIVLEVTGEHPIYIVEKGFVKVRELKEEDEVQFITISDTKKKIKEINQINEPITVYNIEVEDPHNYFANGVLVHNKMSANFDLDIPIEDNNGSDLVETHSTEKSTPDVDIAYPGDDLTENQMERFQRTGENYYEIKYGETISHAFVADGLDNQDIYGYDGNSGIWSELKDNSIAIHTDSDGHTSGYILVYDNPNNPEQIYNVINPDPQIDGTPAGSRLVVLNLPDGYNPINTTELIEDVLIPFQSVMLANSINFANNPEEGFLDLVHTAEYLINETISQGTVPLIVEVEETTSTLPPEASDLFALYINDPDFDGIVPKNFFQTVLDLPGNLVVVHKEVTGNGAFVAALDTDNNGTYDSITVLEFNSPEEEAKLMLAFIPAGSDIDIIEEEIPDEVDDRVADELVEEVFPENVIEEITEEAVDQIIDQIDFERIKEAVVDKIVEEVVAEIDLNEVVDEIVEEVVPETDLDEVVDEIVEEVVPETDLDEVVDEIVEEVVPETDLDEVVDEIVEEVRQPLPLLPENQNFYERFVEWSDENTNTVVIGLGIILTSLVGLSFAERIRRKGWPNAIPTKDEITTAFSLLLGKKNLRNGEIIISDQSERDNIFKIVLGQDQIEAGRYGYIQVTENEANLRVLPFVEGQRYMIGDTEITYPNQTLDMLFMMGVIILIGRQVILTEKGMLQFGSDSEETIKNILKNSDTEDTTFSDN